MPGDEEDSTVQGLDFALPLGQQGPGIKRGLPSGLYLVVGETVLHQVYAACNNGEKLSYGNPGWTISDSYFCPSWEHCRSETIGLHKYFCETKPPCSTYHVNTVEWRHGICKFHAILVGPLTDNAYPPTDGIDGSRIHLLGWSNESKVQKSYIPPGFIGDAANSIISNLSNSHSNNKKQNKKKKSLRNQRK